jgi:antitoxin (DNA-binding transcriptional repressor) of toxin-antitoxin stability system
MIPYMSIRAQDVVPISDVRSRLTELAEDVVAGAEKILTKNGAAYVALVDARKLDYYHALEAEHGRLVMLDDAEKGLTDALTGSVQSEEEFRKSLRRPRTAK